ncbi:hypothetical protein HYH02_004610 [Chlamydomonas schloesseri]|uniref:Protein kinase domain-containing protein n=1 Tax=Chlamydomonas schloesseri TaxID=2026947 RepID=A0A836B8M0_9CHLO|nr:hypothetical protein HYH02_004610 [Chlamydomonas schloesseri]|eukprot:KAG2450773.1 hypothetical protein HYH02_004610 [Chlamydomonas schloesseri]
MGACCSSASAYPEEEDHSDHGEQPIDIRFSNTSQDGNERPTRSTIRSTRGNRDRGSADFGPPVGSRFGSRGVPSPSCSSVSLVPVARTGSYDVRVASRTRQNGGDGVIETTRLIVDHLKGNVFINQYLIIKDLGKGAHGTVKLVYNTQDDMLYAMKVIHKRRMRRQSYLAEPRAVANMMRNVGLSPMSPMSPGSQTDMQRGMSPLASPRTPNGMTDEYSNEIAVMKELDHPNVVKLYEVIHDPSNNKLLMTMEYVEGGCVLAGSSPTQKIPIPEATAVKYFRDVVKGLEYLHFNRIVHGDLKPDNLLMSSSGKVKISDFGSARFCEKSDMIFATAGTPTFMAPEMCQGKQFNGFPGDIWALGICLYMFVFGKPPFVGATTYQIYEAIQRAELAFPHEIPVSGELKDLLGRLLQKDPAERISLEEIPAHPWVTRGGALPVLQTSNERAVQRVFEAMRKRNESGGRRTEPSTVPLAAPPEPVDMTKLVPDAEVRHYKDGDVIIAQGHVPEGLYYVQEGYVDMMLMPSEKKLVADEDFADAIDDEEDEDDEAVVTATANVLDNRRSNGSAEGDGDDGSGSEKRSGKGDGDDDDDDEDDRQKQRAKGVDDFMALFGARLSDRVSPLGSSNNVTPRHHSVAVTPRHGSQTLAPRNNSTTLAPRYASQSLMAGRRPHHHHLSDQHHLMRAAHASASMPLPIPLLPQHSSPAPGSGSVTPHQLHHLPAHLANLAPASPSRSHSRSSTAAGGGSGGVLHSPRQNSVTSRLGPPGGAGAPTRMSLSGGGMGTLQMRLPSYSTAGVPQGGATAGPITSPSPLGLSCSNAADILDADVGRHPPRDERNHHHNNNNSNTNTNDHDRISRERASLTDNTTDGESEARVTNASAPPLDLLRSSASARDPAQSPFLVPSPPSTSPQNSRRQLVQEPSFNPRLQRENSGRRGLSRLAGADAIASSAPVSVPSAAATAGPGRRALLGRAVSNRARHSMDSEDGQTQDAPGRTDGGSTSRRGGSLLGPHASAPHPSTPPSSSGGVVSFPALGSGPLGHPPLPPHHPGSSFKDRKKDAHKENGDGGGGGKDKDDDVLLLSPSESRRLSVTAGGKGSFRKQGGALGGAGVVVASGPPGSVSPPSSVSRVHSTEHGGKPAPGLLPAFDAIVGGNDSVVSEGAASKANSADSIISNADISMQASSSTRGGWRRERPAPVQVSGGGSGLPGGIMPHQPGQPGPRAPSGGGNAQGPPVARAGSNSSCSTGGGGAAPAGGSQPLPASVASGSGGGAAAMSRFRGSVRRSQTHDLEPTQPPVDPDVTEPDRTSTKVSPRYGAGGAIMTAGGGGRDHGHDSMRGMQEDEAMAAAAGRPARSRAYGGDRSTPERLTPPDQRSSAQDDEDSSDPAMLTAPSLVQRRTPDDELRHLPRHAYTDVDRTTSGPPGPPPPEYFEGSGAYSSAQPLHAFRRPGADAARKGRMRRHSTSSYNATNILTRVLGVSTGGAPLDRSSIQEWSTTSKLAQKAIQRSDSMHSRMAQMVLRAKQHAVRRKRRGSMQLVTTRGPGSVVGELCIDGKPAPSPSTVVAKGPVTLLVIKNEKVTKYRNQPSVMAALHRSQNASLVQEAMERFVECEQEVVAVEVIRRTITTEPVMHGQGGAMDGGEDDMDGYTDEHDEAYGVEEEDGEGEGHDDDGERVSSERFMADIYNA